MEPSSAEIKKWHGATLLEFGSASCGFCNEAKPMIADALASRTDVRHVKVEDGPGRPLGRSYSVKLWPTLVLLWNGNEVARVVRPGNVGNISDILSRVPI